MLHYEAPRRICLGLGAKVKKDTLNTSNCVGACLDLWPIFSASTTENADFGAINDSHTTYLMHPLYYFKDDKNAGDIKGDNYNYVWHLVYPPANFTETVDAKLSAQTRTQSYLTDENGMALYTFDNDDINKSNCYGDCETKWPVHATSVDLQNLPEGADAAKFGEITRTDGTKQTTYGGLPLYRFFKDAAAGDTNGDWVNGIWHLIELGSVDDSVAVIGDVQAGATRFAKGCNSCHGDDGRTPALGVSRIIAAINDAATVKDLLTYMKNDGMGKNSAMVRVAQNLSDEEINNLSAYIATLK